MKSIIEIEAIDRYDFPVYFERENADSYVMFQDIEDEIILYSYDTNEFSLTWESFDDITYIETEYYGTNFSIEGRGSGSKLYEYLESDGYEEEEIEDMITRVENIMNDFIQTTGQVTTLDVKTQLRDEGEQITQKEVSRLVSEIYNSSNQYTRETNGQYWIYRDISREQCSCDPCGCSKIPDVFVAVDNYVIDIEDADTGDWEVSDNFGNFIYVDGSVTRSKARIIGEKELGEHYNQIHARKMK